MSKDPYEQKNIVTENGSIATGLLEELERLFFELTASENLINPPSIHIGTQYENPVFLNRNDAGGERNIWDQEEVYGKWRVKIEEGHYNVKFKFIEPLDEIGKMYMETGAIINQFENNRTNIDILEMKNVHLPNIDGDLVPFYTSKSKRIFPFWVEIERIAN
ncbi:hypothetical protein [Maribacter halichondriae]|uniref:hypothetical protein n=1 Tax=Maribacter halichondriae TaxID=2980554 RepID=UPI0023584612|nr:hypothetical protein [Maribacter sp. Hal144]